MKMGIGGVLTILFVTYKIWGEAPVCFWPWWKVFCPIVIELVIIISWKIFISVKKKTNGG